MRTAPPSQRLLLSSLQARGGFTLIEVLVALMIMAILATLAWQGLDGMMRARDGSAAAVARTVRLATVLTQWEQDLQAVVDTGVTPAALAFDGLTLRLTRRTDGGVRVVCWAVRGLRWQRWAGPVVTTQAALADQWQRSLAFQGSEAGQLTLAEDATLWQVYFNWNGSWSNAQSTGDQQLQPVLAPAPAPAASGASAASTVATATAGLAPRPALPEAVRLQITLDGRVLTRDIAVGAGSP